MNKKTLLSIATAVLMAAPALASNVGFEFGTDFFRPKIDPNGADEYFVGQGQNFSIVWGSDTDYWFGYYTENTTLNNGFGNAYLFNVQAVTIGKTLTKGVSVTGHVGAFYEGWNGSTGPLADVSGEVTILSGAGDKVSGDLRAAVGVRFANDTFAVGGQSDWSGLFANLSVGLNF